MDGKIHFHIGCTYHKESILLRMRSDGHRVYVLDEVGLRSKQDCSVGYLCIRGMKDEEIEKAIRKIADDLSMEIGYFFTFAEGSVDLLNRMLKRFSLSPISNLDSSISLRDKYRLRQRMASVGLDIHTLELAVSPDTIPLLTSSQFPVIVKPVSSMESRGVRKAHDQDQLEQGCLNIFTQSKTTLQVDDAEIVLEEVYSQPSQALIESFFEGTKYSHEVVVVRGEILFCHPTWMYDGQNEFFYERAAVFAYDNFSIEVRRKLTRFLDLIVNANQVETSILHVETILDRSGEWRLIEVNFRLGGGCIPDLMHESLSMEVSSIFLRQVENLKDNLFLECKPGYPVVGYDFLTGIGGFFYPHRFSIKGYPIQWNFSEGQQVSKFPTSGFYALGAVTIPSTLSDIEKLLEEVRSEESSLYHLSVNPKPARPVVTSSKFLDWGGSVFKVAKQPYFITAIFMLVAVVTIVVTKISKEQSEFVGRALSATVSHQVMSGEFFVIGEVVEKFRPDFWFEELVVTDANYRVLFSRFDGGPSRHKFYSIVDSKFFESAFSIQSDGLVIGYVLVNRSSMRLILYIFLLSGALTLVASLIQYVIIRVGIFDRIKEVRRILNESSDLLESLSKDLNDVGDSERVIDFLKYRDRLASMNFAGQGVDGLRSALERVVEVTAKVRDHINTKRRMSGLLLESTSQLRSLRAESEISMAIARTTQMLAHDIRRPFSMIQSAVRILDDSKSAEEFISGFRLASPEILRAIGSAENMLRDVMGMSGELNLDLVSTDLSQVFNDCLESLRRSHSNGHSIRVRLDFPESSEVIADSFKIGRVVENILDNAFSAVGDQGEIWCYTEPVRDEFLTIVIGNSGAELEDSIVSRLFEPFFTSNKKGGTGLGLAIARRIVQAHGGRIDYRRSVDHGGIEFYFSLPISGPKQNVGIERLNNDSDKIFSALPRASGEYEVSTEGKSLPIVAIVDDSDFFLRTWRYMQKNQGEYQIKTFSGPVSFWNNLSSRLGEIALVVTDYRFSVDADERPLVGAKYRSASTGLDFARQLRHERPNIKIIVCSDAYLDPEQDLTSINRFVPKQVFDEKELRDLVLN